MAYTHMQSGTQSDHVNLRDFKRVLAACGIKMKSARDQERAKAIFHKIDANHNGTIDFNEFVQGIYGVDKTVSERILGYRYCVLYGLSAHVLYSCLRVRTGCGLDPVDGVSDCTD